MTMIPLHHGIEREQEKFALDFLSDHPGALIFATVAGSKRPPAGSHGHHDATGDVGKLRGLAAHARSRRSFYQYGGPNYALANGSQWLVIEDDKEYLDGDARVLRLLDRVGLPGNTWRIDTRRGHHYVYSLPPDPVLKDMFQPEAGLEVRTGGSTYSMLPFSVVDFDDDKDRHWVYGCDDDREIARASPDTVAALAELRDRVHVDAKRSKGSGSVRSSNAQATPAVAVVGHGVMELLELHLRAEVAVGRNDLVYGLALDCVARGLSRDVVEMFAPRIVDVLDRAFSKAHPYDLAEAIETIASAYRSRKSELVVMVQEMHRRADLESWRPATTRYVLNAIGTMVIVTGSATPSIDARRLGNLVGVTHGTATRATQRLRAGGWLKGTRASFGKAMSWDIRIPADPKRGVDAPISRERGTQLGGAGTPLFRSAVDHDAFRHRGLGKASAAVFDRLNGSPRPWTVREMADVLHRRDLRTVRDHLHRLAGHGLVKRADDRQWQVADGDMGALLDQVAEELGTAGMGERQAAKYAAQSADHAHFLSTDGRRRTA